MAYEMVDPFGEYRDDLRAGIVASTIANANRPKGKRAYKPEDFMPRFADQEQQSIAEMHAVFREFAEAHNAALREKEAKEGQAS